MQSGISASTELHTAFQSLLSSLPPSGTQRGLLVTIRNEQLTPHTVLPSSNPDFLSDLSALQQHLLPTEALYIILSRHPSAPDGLVAVTYIPDSAPVRQKMLFASTRLTLTRELGTERFRETLFVTTKEELLPEGWKKHDSHVGLAAPLTEEERTLKGVREAEAQEGSRGTGARSSHVSSGLSFPVSQKAIQALRTLGEGQGEALVQLKIDVSSESIELVGTSAATAESLASEISSSEPRYSFFRYEHEHEGASSAPVVFIYTCPSGSKIKERMLYASSRGGVISTAETEAGVTVAKRLEATMPDEITAQSIHEEFHPRVEQKQGFSRPKRPGKR